MRICLYRNWGKEYSNIYIQYFFLCTFWFTKAFSASKESGTILWDGCKFGSSSMFSGVCYPERALSFIQAALGGSDLFDAWIIILKEAGVITPSSSKPFLSFQAVNNMYVCIYIYMCTVHICIYTRVLHWFHDAG